MAKWLERLYNKERVLRPDLIRLVYLIVAVASFMFTELFRIRLRPIFREYGINDWGFTDSIGNGGGILAQIFLALAILNPNQKQSYQLAALLSCGYVVYEFLQPILPKGTFDWNDIWATGIGCLISLITISYINHRDTVLRGRWFSSESIKIEQ